MKKDLYVDDLAEETGKLFETLCMKKYDMNKVIPLYMTSTYRQKCDERHPKFATAMAYEQERDFFDVIDNISKYKIKNMQYDPILCSWIGEFYTYLQEKTKLSSADIINKYPFIDLYIKSKGLHDLSPEIAVDKFKIMK